MAQNIRITITPEIEKALQILRKSTLGTLNTTELIKMALGEAARKKEVQNEDLTSEQLDYISARQIYEWAKEDGSLQTDNISIDAKLEPFVPEPYVSDR